MQLLTVTTLNNQDISTDLLVASYVATRDQEIFIRLFADQILGNGKYNAYVNVQRDGVGSFCTFSPITIADVPAGTTAIAFTTMLFPLSDTDVIRVYIKGLAGDIATPDIICEVWDVTVWDDTLTDHHDPDSAGLALFNASTSTVFPAGAIPFTYTITSSVAPFGPIEGVEVWFSTDNPAVNIVWKGDTDAFGVARDVHGNLPNLDVGTYYIWRQKAGVIFVDPDIEIVS